MGASLHDLLRPLLALDVPAWVLGPAIAAILATLLFGLRRLLVSRLTRLAGRTSNTLDDLLRDVVARTKGWFLLALSAAAGAAALPGTPAAGRLLQVVTIAALGLQAGLWGTTLLVGLVRRGISDSQEGSVLDRTTIGVLRFLIHLVVWSALLLLVLANLGVDVTALVAGLGVGGVAVALAVQSVLGDVFASLSIVLDRPFEVGDFIIVDDLMGTVEQVGLKTTRVRSLWGEQLIFSNSNLLNARIRNFQRMKERRVVFSLGVTYQTSAERVRRIPGLVRAAVESASPTRFDRAHFTAFGDFALSVEVVYFVLDPDYNRYMDIQQQINLSLLEQFAREGIEFAYPTQTLFLTRAPAPPLQGAAP